MELTYYMRIVRRWWWLAVIPIVGVTGLSILLTRNQPDVFESTATFVVRPRMVEGSDAVRATDYLVRTADIPPTIAQIAQSDSVRAAALTRLPPNSAAPRQAISVDSDVLVGTTILTISAAGPDPALTQTYVGLLAEETVAYIESLNYLFTLSALDQPSLATQQGTGRSLTVAGAAVLGVLLAALGVFLAEYLRQPRERVRSFDILDRLTGLHNEDFFAMRFEQELSRSERTGAPLTVATVHIEGAGDDGSTAARDSDVQTVAGILTLCTRTEDVLAHVGNATIMALLPESEEDRAEQLNEQLHRLLWPATDGAPPPMSPFTVHVGVCQYGADASSGGSGRMIPPVATSPS